MESVVEKLIESESSKNEAEVVEKEEDHNMNEEHDMSEEHDMNEEPEDHEHDKNCHKCHKASFKYRKDLFCGKCVKKGLVNLEKDAGKNLHCKKCKKSKFRVKNGDFCEMKCSTQMKEDNVESEATTEATETTATPDAFKLGPLGSLLKYFVVSNTWGQANPLPEADVEE
jgi:hypothetical protein